MRIRRALLFMPGDDRRKIEKGAASGVDAIIMDLEDGVALSRKAEARATIAAALGSVNFGRSERLVRLNPVGSELVMDDLASTVIGQPDGYVIPKVESAAQVQHLAAALADTEHDKGWPPERIRLLAIVETAKGIVNLREIAASSPRLDALIFGAEDLAGDIGATRTREGWEVFYSRGAVVVHAKAAGLDAVDTVFIDLNDLDGLIADAGRARTMGYTGKLAIHLRQIEPIQAAFTPSVAEVQRAQRIVAAHAAQQAAGRGAFELDGKMIDMPIVRAAEVVLARARAAGMNPDAQ